MMATRGGMVLLWMLLGAFGGIGASMAAEPSSSEQRTLGTLGPGDSVSIQIVGQPETTTVYVGDDGTINVPLVGAVQVAGTSPVEAESKVAQALKAGGLFVNPQVIVTVTQSRSEVVSVLGEVQSSGRYPVSPRTTVVDLLAQAGGVKDGASEIVYVLRRDASGALIRYSVDLTGLSNVENPLPSQILQGGDSLVVPPAEHFYVEGEVTTPGTYRLEPGMTVIQAIARAGGITPRGSERRVQIKRARKSGDYQTVHPKSSDPVQPGDIIRVKESIF
jgi:polysaccharide biosynthesis/export protein